MPSDFDREDFRYNMVHGTWFSAKLLRLISDADEYNRERLRIAYPDAVAAFEFWKRTGKNPTIENMHADHEASI